MLHHDRDTVSRYISITIYIVLVVQGGMTGSIHTHTNANDKINKHTHTHTHTHTHVRYIQWSRGDYITKCTMYHAITRCQPTHTVHNHMIYVYVHVHVLFFAICTHLQSVITSHFVLIAYHIMSRGKHMMH